MKSHIFSILHVWNSKQPILIKKGLKKQSGHLENSNLQCVISAVLNKFAVEMAVKVEVLKFEFATQKPELSKKNRL